MDDDLSKILSRIRCLYSVTLVLGAVCGWSGLDAAGTSLLSATTLDDRHFSIANERGRVVLINFWATWCAPCRAEMPLLDAYYRARHKAGLDMLAVSLDEGLSNKGAARATAGFAFPVALLAVTKIEPVDIPTRLPVTRIYARNGALRYDSSALGARRIDAETLAAIVEPLLRELP